MNPYHLGDAFHMARGSVYSFHLLETVAGFPQPIRHRDMC